MPSLPGPTDAANLATQLLRESLRAWATALRWTADQLDGPEEQDKHDERAPASEPAPERPPVPAPPRAAVPPRPAAPPPPPPGATPDPVRPPPPRRESPHAPAAPPAHVSEEPVLAAQSADAGAEAGAGAEIHVSEPWPGYAALSAPDVVDHLVVATDSEIAVIELYESAHRARQTVLTAAAQELATRSPTA